MIDIKKSWYDNLTIKYEIVKILKGRETAIRSPSEKLTWRCLKIHNVDYMKSNFDRFDFDKHLFNIYYSLAHLKDMPIFSFNIAKRKEQQKDFNANFKDYYNGYDIGIDFDSHIRNEKFEIVNLPVRDVQNQVQEFKEILDLYDVPYTLKFSGSGFHVNIPHFAQEGINNVLTTAKRLNDDLFNVYNLKSVDTSITDLRRIWKCPYSLDTNTGNIALPLDDTQFENFNLDMVKPAEVLNLKLRDRGECLRDGRKDNFKKMLIEEFDYNEDTEFREEDA